MKTLDAKKYIHTILLLIVVVLVTAATATMGMLLLHAGYMDQTNVWIMTVGATVITSLFVVK